MDASQIGKRAWSYAGVLQDAGLSCFEYVEQLTLLLFLKMDDQQTEPPYNRQPLVPSELGWKTAASAGRRVAGGEVPRDSGEALPEAGDAGRDLQERPLRDQ